MTSLISSTKHSAVLVDYIRTRDNDLALLKMEQAFDGVPTVGELSLETPEPSGGTEVFCIGFPLGRSVMQQGETVIASTFRGIVSRKVQSYLQVDAAIHPGASGGPVIDGAGKVIGVGSLWPGYHDPPRSPPQRRRKGRPGKGPQRLPASLRTWESEFHRAGSAILVVKISPAVVNGEHVDSTTGM